MVSSLRGLPVTNVTQRYRLYEHTIEHSIEHTPTTPHTSDSKPPVVQYVSFTPVSDSQSAEVYPFPVDIVKACIQEEADVYGYIPRNLFL